MSQLPELRVPVITIDGASGTGKGTIAAKLSAHLGFHFLDSGAVYRALALAAMQRSIAVKDIGALSSLAVVLRLTFSPKGATVLLDGADVTDRIRTEQVGELASQIAAYSEVRDALLTRQRDFCKLPGLVADGRDMGTVVFPDAIAKIFLSASAEERAKRRQNQLKAQGVSVSLTALVSALKRRDERDQTRAVSPLKPAQDAVLVDTTTRSIDAVFERVLAIVKARLAMH